jgi:ubiquinone/menaquinone biosynthesis C-methylase UbiE
MAKRNPIERQAFWARYFAVYDRLNQSPLYRRLVLRHVELLEPARGDVILDAGAGTGNVTQVLAVPGARVTGIDFCAPALERCREKIPDAEFRQADLTQPLPFETDSFDKIACSVVLHFLDPARQQFALSELFRVLRPGGLLAVSVFATRFNAMRVYVETIREIFRTESFANAILLTVRSLIDAARILYYQLRIKLDERAGEYQYFTADTLRGMLQRSGFSVPNVERIYADQCLIALASKPRAVTPEATT